MKKNATLFIGKKFKTQFRFSNPHPAKENFPIPCSPVQASLANSPTSSKQFSGRINCEV